MLKYLLKQFKDVKREGHKEFIKKLSLLFKLITTIPFYLVAVVCWVFITLVRPFVLIRIDVISSTNFGYFVLTPALYYCKKKLKIDQPERKCIDLFCLDHQGFKKYNKQIEKMWRRKLFFLPSILLKPIYNINKIIPKYKIPTLNIQSKLNIRDVENLIEKYQPLSFTKEEENIGKENLFKFGLNENDKFVCLAVRDAAYQNEKISPKLTDWSHHNFRNEDIDNFTLAAEELTKRGYFVFRMGVVAEKQFKTNNPKIIDYAFSKYRSDFMDVYLGAKCSFCISTGLGFDEVPYVFGRPIAYLVLPVGEFRTHNEKFLITTKKHLLLNENRKLSLSEIFKYGLAYAFDTKIYEKKGVKLIDYEPEEIKEFTLEMLEMTENKSKTRGKSEILQKSFQKIYKTSLENLSPDEKGKSPYIKSHCEIKSNFSSSFLEKNNWWLK